MCSQRCEHGWMHAEGHCLLLESTPAAHAGASTACAAHGQAVGRHASLASFNTSAQLAAVRALLDQYATVLLSSRTFNNTMVFFQW